MRNVSLLSKLLPSQLQTLSDDEAQELYTFYKCHMPSTLADFETELAMYRIVEWKSDGIEHLAEVNKDHFPCIHRLLIIFFTLPTTSVINERSFSTLRRLKNYMRSRIIEDRLSAITLLHIHDDVPVSAEECCTAFAKINHRLDFEL